MKFKIINKGNKVKYLLFLFILFFNSESYSYEYKGDDAYVISSNSFTNTGWNVPLQGKMSTGSHWDYNSAWYAKEYGFDHGAVDIFAFNGLGSTVYSIGDGKIKGFQREYGNKKNMSSVYIKYRSLKQEFIVLYGHVFLDNSLSVGDEIKKGQKIGAVTKFNTPHIHFSITTDMNYPVDEKQFGSIRNGITNPLVFLTNNNNKGCAGYRDVSSANKYCKSIRYAKDHKIMNGYGDGYFYSNDKLINRAEFIKVVLSARNILLQSLPKCFSDLESSTTWYTPYVCTAKQRGIIKGDGGGVTGTFRPEAHINYVEALKIALKAYGYTGLEVGTNWYDTYIAKAKQEGIDRLKPSEKVGRDFAAHLLCQINEKILEKNDGGKCSE